MQFLQFIRPGCFRGSLDQINVMSTVLSRERNLFFRADSTTCNVSSKKRTGLDFTLRLRTLARVNAPIGIFCASAFDIEIRPR